MSTTGTNNASSSSTTIISTTLSTTLSTVASTTTAFVKNATNNTATRRPTTPRVQEEGIWFYITNPLFILLLTAMSTHCVYSIYVYMSQRRRASAEERKVRKIRISVLICVCLFGILRSISLGMQIKMAKSTTGVIEMFSFVRIAALAPLYGAMLIILRKWVIICIHLCNPNSLERVGVMKMVTNAIAVVVHLYIYLSLLVGLIKNSNADYDETWFNELVNNYSALAIIILGILFFTLSVSGCFAILRLMMLQRQNLRFNIRNHASRKFVKKLAILLVIFLVGLGWRTVDYAIYKYAKTSDGKPLYPSNMQVKLYPLNSTFPECLPMIACFWLYMANLPWKRKKNHNSSDADVSTSVTQHKQPHTTDTTQRSPITHNTPTTSSSTSLTTSNTGLLHASVNVYIPLENLSENRLP